MKKTLLFLVVLAGLVSCQVVKQDDRYIKLDETKEGERNVLLMDFTGWQCVNCPEAAKVANGLVSRYGSHVIVVSMHPEGISFTDPGAGGPKFATKEAMDYLKAFGGSSTLPTGVIDGTQFNGSYFQKYQDWAALVTERMPVEVEYSMEMKATTASCSVSLYKNGVDNRKVNVVMWLLEDSIIAPQLTSEGVENEYAHRHVFRKCLNGTDIWGEEVEFDYGEGYVNTTYQLPTLEGRNFVVVAVAFDAETHEVLQAEEVELKQRGVGSFNIIYEGDTLQDGDTIDVTKINYLTSEVEFDGIINSTYAVENEFTIVETRHFDYLKYTVTLCVFNACRPDNEDNPGFWGPFEFAGLSDNEFQGHVKIPKEELDQTITLETDYCFGDGATTKTIRVRFHYVPEEQD